MEHVRAGADAYNRQNGLAVPNTDYSRIAVPQSVVSQVGHAYLQMPEHDPHAVAGYHAMREETGRQFDHLTRSTRQGGMGFQVEVTPHDPYRGPEQGGTGDFFRDVGQHRIKVMSTATTGGHPLFDDDSNDMFRAVHDVFGHAGTGRGVDRHGEEAAYLKHASMFTPLARQALATETRGQNHALIVTGQFQDQKIGYLPPHLQDTSLRFQGTPAEHSAATLQAQQFHAPQFEGGRYQ